jgi:hypothetical protein
VDRSYESIIKLIPNATSVIVKSNAPIVVRETYLTGFNQYRLLHLYAKGINNNFSNHIKIHLNMKKFVTFIIVSMVAMTFIASMSSCMGTRYGCPISASHSFGPGR